MEIGGNGCINFPNDLYSYVERETPVLNSHIAQQMGWLWSVMLMHRYVGRCVCA